jgi:hypothetical protein
VDRDPDDRRRDARRAEDHRLQALEELAKAHTLELAQIRSSLGDQFTTLIFTLDQRYMPRAELKTVYVPRREHEERQRYSQQMRMQWPLVVFAGLGWATNLVLVLVHT